MDPGPLGGLQSLPGRVYVLGHRPGEARHRAAADLARDLAHRGQVARARDREARLDDVDAELLKLAGHLELFPQVHATARSLLAVS